MRTPTDVIVEGAALYTKGDAEAYSDLYRDDAVLTTPDGRYEGRQAIRTYCESLMSPWPGAVVTVGRHGEDGDLYFGEFVLRGTNDGPLTLPDGSELPATHRSAELQGMEIAQVADGQIVQHDMAWDNLGVMAQLGLLPA